MAHHESEIAAVGAVGTVAAAFVAAWAVLRGREKSPPAETQAQINAGFQSFMEEARVEIADLKTKERAHKQYIQLLVRLLLERGIEVPPMPEGDGFIQLPALTANGASHAD